VNNPPAPAHADHLARFDVNESPPDAPTGAVASHGESWTYERTLAELRRRGGTLIDAEPGVRYAERGRTPAALARAVVDHAATLRSALRHGVLDGSTPAPWAARAWDEATRVHAAWFGLAFSPPGVVHLDGGRRITDMRRFRDAVARRLAAGPAAPGAHALAGDLAALYARFGPAPSEMRVVRTRRPLAA
jgi:hypothetical protein